MHVSEHIKESKGKTLLSFEILPPLRGVDIKSLYAVIDPLVEMKPSFINVTYHRSEFIYKRRGCGDFYEKISTRKRPGTVGICAAILNKYHIDPVPHIICGGFTKMETEDALIDLHYLGVDNILALRGDPAKNETQFSPELNGNASSIELLQQINCLNQGKFIEEEINNGFKTNFNIGVGCYPEKHGESPNIASDVEMLKIKVESGAKYCITQMFFNNKKYFDFVDTLKKEKINIPIIPGLKPITSEKQLYKIPKIFHVDIPEDLCKAVKASNNKKTHIEKIGEEWLLYQAKELYKAGVPVLHFYTLGSSKIIKNVIKQIF